MSKRERWIVYPLLFFALSLGFRERVRTEASYSSLDVQQLKVRRINGRPAVATSPSPAFDSKLIRDTIQSALETLTPDKPSQDNEVEGDEAEEGEVEGDEANNLAESDPRTDETSGNDEATEDPQPNPPAPDDSSAPTDSEGNNSDAGGA